MNVILTWLLLSCLAGIFVARAMAQSFQTDTPDDPDFERSILDEIDDD